MIEQKLIAIDAAVDQAAKYTQEIGAILKAMGKASDTGDLGQIRRRSGELNDLLSSLSSVCAQIKTEAEFDEKAYLGSVAFLDEIYYAAEAAGVRIVKGVDGLYSFPTILKVNPQKQCLLIGKRRESRLRPRFVAQELKRLQSEARRLSESVFLEIVFSAYRIITNKTEPAQDGMGTVVPLTQIYSTLTLLPHASREYSHDDFAIDVYRLDRSRLQRTRSGALVSLPASTGTRGSSSVLSVITESGEEIRYFGVSFRIPTSMERTDDTAVA